MSSTDSCPECGQRFGNALHSLDTGESVHPHDSLGKIIVCHCGVLLAVAGLDPQERLVLRIATEGDLDAQSIEHRRRFKVASRVIPQAPDGLTTKELHSFLTDAFDQAGV